MKDCPVCQSELETAVTRCSVCDSDLNLILGMERLPDDMVTWAEQCLAEGDYRAANRWCDLALELRPEHEGAAWVKALSLEGLDRPEEALMLWLEVVARQPTNKIAQKRAAALDPIVARRRCLDGLLKPARRLWQRSRCAKPDPCRPGEPCAGRRGEKKT